MCIRDRARLHRRLSLSVRLGRCVRSNHGVINFEGRFVVLGKVQVIAFDQESVLLCFCLASAKEQRPEVGRVHAGTSGLAS